MIDLMTRRRISVSPGPEGPSIMVPEEQVSAIEMILRANHVRYWVDAYAISLNGEPETTVIDFERGASADQIQRLLDATQ